MVVRVNAVYVQVWSCSKELGLFNCEERRFVVVKRSR